MMRVDRKQFGDRFPALIGVGLIHALLGYALFAGLSVRVLTQPDEVLKLFTVEPPKPPPPIAEKKPAAQTAPLREGAAAPRNIRSHASEIRTTQPPIVIAPPPIVAAPIPAVGDERSSGASPLPGPGTGSGGQGAGTGSGSYGDGPGGGGGIGPRQVKGRIRSSDYPQIAVEEGASGIVSVRYTVAIDGHVSRCIVTRSSGSRDLDETTCRLIEQRFRFDPARDAYGRAVQADIVEDHEWIMERVIEEKRR